MPLSPNQSEFRNCNVQQQVFSNTGYGPWLRSAILISIVRWRKPTLLHHLSRATLEWKYFAGLKFCDFDESPFFEVIKFCKSSNWWSFFKLPLLYFYLTITEQKRNKQLPEMFNNVSNIVTSFKSKLIEATEALFNSMALPISFQIRIASMF